MYIIYILKCNIGSVRGSIYKYILPTAYNIILSYVYNTIIIFANHCCGHILILKNKN